MALSTWFGGEVCDGENRASGVLLCRAWVPNELVELGCLKNRVFYSSRASGF